MIQDYINGYIKSEDVDSFAEEPDAKKMLKEMLERKDARFFVNKFFSKYPDFLKPKKKENIEIEMSPKEEE